MRKFLTLIATVTLGAGALGFLGIGGAPAAADPPSEPTGPAMMEEHDPVETIIDRDSRVVYHLVGEGLSVTSYDNFARGAAGELSESFEQAITNDADADHRFILFENHSLIDDLSAASLLMLLEKFEDGEWIIGVKGFGRDLKAGLGLLEPALEAAGTTTGGPGLAVFLHRSPAGHLNELTIAAPLSAPRAAHGRPHDDDSLGVAFNFAHDWYKRNKEPLLDDDDPWSAIHNFEWSGTTKGSYHGNEQTIGTYKFTLSMFFVASDQEINNVPQDWYRADFQTISDIENYEYKGYKFGDTSGKCGWWITKMKANVAVITPNGQWWDYMPDSSVGSKETTQSIGGDISTDGGGGRAEYSKSYGTSDVTLAVHPDSVDETIAWSASLSGCGGYDEYPDYHGASTVAKTSYDLDPSFIIAVPTSGDGLKLETSVDDVDWEITLEKDRIDCNTTCTSVKVHQYKSTYYKNTSISCTTTSCS